MASSSVAGVILGNDEQEVSAVSLLTSNLFVWIKLNLVLTSRRLVGQQPNFFLGIIPVGSHNVTYPLANIAGVSLNTKLSIPGLLFGALLVLIGVSDLRAVLALLLGVLLIVQSYYAEIRVTNTGGQTLAHRVSVFDKTRAQELVQQVNTAIANRI